MCGFGLDHTQAPVSQSYRTGSGDDTPPAGHHISYHLADTGMILRA